MALLFLDGFDHTGNSGATAVSILKSKYASSSGTVLMATSPTRTGSGVLLVQQTMALDRTIPTLAMGTAFFTGFVYQKTWSTPGSTVPLVLSGQGGVAAHIGVGINAGGRLVVYLGSTSTILATGPTPLAMYAWQSIEFKGVVHDTLGSFEVRLDGVTEISVSNVDTRNGGSGVVNTISLLGGSIPANSFVDDFWICDDTGPAPCNTFLGPVKIDTLYPQTDGTAQGSNAGLSATSPFDHGGNVDESTPNTNDYNYSTVAGAKDTYNFPSQTIPGAVVGIQANLYASKSDIQPRQVCAVVRTNSVDYDGASVSPLTGYGYITQPWGVNPNTGVAWTSAEIAAIQVGMKVTV